MSEPVTNLDARFSDPEQDATTWADSREVLERAEISWISTVSRSGAPHVTPLVAVWLDEALHFCTGVDEQKAVNLRGNPAVVLTTGRNDWDRGLDVVVEGEAVEVNDQQRLERLAEAWKAKWDGRWTYEVGEGCFHGSEDDSRVLVFAVEPKKVFAFSKGVFTHTRHRF